MALKIVWNENSVSYGTDQNEIAYFSLLEIFYCGIFSGENYL
jgi:hypothetical protein